VINPRAMPSGRVPLHLVNGVEDFLSSIGEIGLTEARTRRPPFLALVGQRDALHQPVELTLSILRASMPIMRCQPCIDTWFITCSSTNLFRSACAPPPTASRDAGSIGKCVLEILVDDGRVGDDDAVMIEHRDLPFRVDRYEPVRVLLEPVQIDIHTLVRQSLLEQRIIDLSEFATGSA